MRFKIRGDHNLRRRELLLALQPRDDLCREKMRIDNCIPRLFENQIRQLRQIQPLNEQAQSIAR